MSQLERTSRYVLPDLRRMILLFLLIGLALLLGSQVKAASPFAGTFEAATGQPGMGVGLGDISSVNEQARYIIQFAELPLASYRGGIAGLAPTNPGVRGEVMLNPDSPASVAYLNYLTQKQAQFVTALEQAVGHPLEVVFQYKYAYNGMAVRLTAQEAAIAARLPGVLRVQREFVRYPVTDAGPAWIGASGVWDGSSTGGLAGTKGEQIVAGIIDTGINHDHPSFASVGGDGYSHTNPRGQHYGVCAPLNPVLCNNKLIGMYDFTGTTPFDDNEHGSHTASTTAGNVVTATLIAPTVTITRTISGVAPHANIISYKACITSPVLGGCLSPSLVAAIDQATADRVDVINYSIGGGSSDPWNDADAQAFLGARDAGVFVSAAAGNAGPQPATLGSPADAPWLLAVGASTHNRKFVNSLINMSGGGSAAPANMSGKSLTAGYGPAPIVYAGAAPYNNPLCNPFTAGTFTNQIVVCERGVIGRVQKGQNVKDAGGKGMVLANDQANGNSLIADAHVLPAVHITYSDGVTLKAWLASGSAHMATIAGTSLNLSAANGDIMAGFSSRGPDPSVPDILKPDVTAPGVDVLAAINTPAGSVGGPPEYGILSGTSMATPHSAGAAALIRALHRNWTPAQVQSALMTTALNATVRKEDGLKPADPFDMGAGRVDLSKAGRAGLVLNETRPRYDAANPSTGGDPKTLNLPSMANSNCKGTCSWTRVVSSTRSINVTWTASTTVASGLSLSVTPTSFTLTPNLTQTITVTANVANLPVNQWFFGQVTLSPNDPSIPDAHFPVAVVPGGGPQLVEIRTRRDAGSQSLTMTTTVPIVNLTPTIYGLAPGRIAQRQLAQDPTPLDPYDGLGGTFYITITVPAGAKFLNAEIVDTTASDLDLYVGRDTNGDGAPQQNEQVCASAGSTAFEACRLVNPAAGTYWIMVQDWLTGRPPQDDVVLQAVVIPGTNNGNLTVSGPGSVPAGTAFNARVFWNEPAMQAGDVWFGLAELASAPGAPANVGVLLVKIVRFADDVSKAVSATSASAGSTLNYTITVQANVRTDTALAYNIIDTVPSGLSYVPNSAAVTTGTVHVTGNQVRWDVTMPASGSASQRLSFQATVNNNPPCTIVNPAIHNTDNPGSQQKVVTATVNITGPCVTPTPNTAPTAMLSVTPTLGVAPLAVNVNGSASSDPDSGDSIVSYTFDFGDGSAPVTQSTPTLSHTYRTPGTYRASLVVTDSRGSPSTNNAVVDIKVLAPSLWMPMIYR